MYLPLHWIGMSSPKNDVILGDFNPTGRTHVVTIHIFKKNEEELIERLCSDFKKSVLKNR